MRVISNERDFYDNASGGIIDRSFIYDRKSQEIDTKELSKKFVFPYNSYVIGRGEETHFEFVYIFFCGTIYCGVRRNDTDQKNKWTFGEEAKFTYQGSAFLFHGSRRSEFFSHDGANCHKLNVGYESPIVVFQDGWRKSKAFRDCVLAGFDFMTVFDPYQARQKIEQFLRNDLASQEDPKPLSDKTRVLAHGFDKFSFRKCGPPTRKIK